MIHYVFDYYYINRRHPYNKYVNSKLCSHPTNPKCNIGDIASVKWLCKQWLKYIYCLRQRLNWNSLLAFLISVRRLDQCMGPKYRKLLATLRVREYDMDGWVHFGCNFGGVIHVTYDAFAWTCIYSHGTCTCCLYAKARTFERSHGCVHYKEHEPIILTAFFCWTISLFIYILAVDSHNS